MIINLSPQVREDTIKVSKYGDVLVINGNEFDFGPLPEGAYLPVDAIAGEYFVNGVTRVDGQIEITLVFPIPWWAPDEWKFPFPIINPKDGEVQMPTDSLAQRSKEDNNDRLE